MRGRRNSRFNQIVLSHLLKMKGSLGVAVLCLVGYTAIDLLKPWPIKILFGYILLHHPLPPALSFLEGVLQDRPLFSLSVVAGVILCISLLSGVFSYSQVYLTTKVGYQLSATLEDEFVALSAQSIRAEVKTYAALTRVRHIYLSTLFSERRSHTKTLLEYCEQELAEMTKHSACAQA